MIKGTNLGRSMSISGGRLIGDGNIPHANALSFNMSDSNGDITARFSYTGEYYEATMILTVNGRDIKFKLDYLQTHLQLSR